MGRAIVRRPQVFLMDEPLSNLDAKLRVQVRAQISQLQDDLGVTTIYVTHDQVEAMTMGDRVAVMRKGVLQQVAAPQEVYDQPVNLFVAGFIGSPAMNFLEARVEEAEGGLCAVVGETRLALGPHLVEARPGIREYLGEEIVLGIRPEGLEDAAQAPEAGEGRRLQGTVELREALGSEIVAHIRVPEAVTAITEHVIELAEDVGADDVALGASADSAVVIGRLSPRSQTSEGEAIELVVDSESLHFFDPESGLAIYDERPRTREVEDEGGETTEAPEPVVAAGADPGGGADGPGGRRLRWRRR